MNFKKDLNVLIWIISICLLIAIFVPLGVAYNGNKLSESEKELNRLETKINSYNKIYVKGYNLNLNSNFSKTTLAIDNSLNLSTDEYKYVSFEGYLFTSKPESIKIKLNVNGYTASMTKDIEYLIKDNSDLQNYNINKIIEMNNKYFAATKYGIFISDDGVNFKKISSNYDAKDIYKDQNNQRVYFLTTENKLVYYSFKTNQFSVYEWSHMIHSVCIIENILYIASDDGLYSINTLNGNSKKITTNIFIQLKNYLNNLYLVGNDSKLYKWDNNKLSMIYDDKVSTSLAVTLTGSVYFISNNNLYIYLSLENKIEKVNLEPIIYSSTIIKDIYIGINNHLYISTDKGVYDYKYNGAITQIENLNFNDVKIFQSSDQTLYFYSQDNFTGIKFYQDFN